MKKLLSVACLLLIAALVLTGCKAPEAAEEEPTAAPTPEATPVYVAPTPDPTVTPRILGDNVETPAPDATPILIRPADEPSPAPLAFAPYGVVTEPALEVQFEVPSDWVREQSPNANEAVYAEPVDNILSKTTIPAKLFVQVITFNTATTEKDAKDQIDTILNGLLTDYTQPDFSSKAENQVMGVTGWYSTYRVTYTDPVTNEETRLRGRCLVAPKDRKLYVIRFICPANFNTDYLNVFYQVRKTLKLTQ